MPDLRIPSEVENLLDDGAHLVVNVSGGADSNAMLVLLWAHRGRWPGQFHVIHAHLGRNEWRFTLPHIRTFVPQITGQPPVIVEREAGDLLARWWQRFETLKAQGRDVPPWSSSAARFCTSEMKTQICHRWIRQQFPREAVVISALGIRSQESAGRARKPVFAPEKSASAPTKQRHVYRWLPIHHFTLADVWNVFGWSLNDLNALRAEVRERIRPGNDTALHDLLARRKYRQHPAYALGNTRVSCAACVLASRGDLLNGIAWQSEHFRDLVDLEIASGFSFQPGRWLADLPDDDGAAFNRQDLTRILKPTFVWVIITDLYFTQTDAFIRQVRAALGDRVWVIVAEMDSWPYERALLRASPGRAHLIDGPVTEPRRVTVSDALLDDVHAGIQAHRTPILAACAGVDHTAWRWPADPAADAAAVFETRFSDDAVIRQLFMRDG